MATKLYEMLIEEYPDNPKIIDRLEKLKKELESNADEF